MNIFKVAYLVGLFEVSILSSIFAKRVTILPKDNQLARRISRYPLVIQPVTEAEPTPVVQLVPVFGVTGEEPIVTRRCRRRKRRSRRRG